MDNEVTPEEHAIESTRLLCNLWGIVKSFLEAEAGLLACSQKRPTEYIDALKHNRDRADWVAESSSAILMMIEADKQLEAHRIEYPGSRKETIK